MRLIVQRVLRGAVRVAKKGTIGKIDRGVVVLVGIERRDTKDDIEYLARKLVNLKLWSNETGKPWRKSAKEKNFGVLLVSQFTLHAVLKGNKPDFHMSMVPDKASECFDQFVKRVEMEYGKKEAVEKGEFGAKMEVDLVNEKGGSSGSDAEASKKKKKKKK
eukprot:g2041.t1